MVLGLVLFVNIGEIVAKADPGAHPEGRAPHFAGRERDGRPRRRRPGCATRRAPARPRDSAPPAPAPPLPAASARKTRPRTGTVRRRGSPQRGFRCRGDARRARAKCGRRWRSAPLRRPRRGSWRRAAPAPKARIPRHASRRRHSGRATGASRRARRLPFLGMTT